MNAVVIGCFRARGVFIVEENNCPLFRIQISLATKRERKREKKKRTERERGK